MGSSSKTTASTTSARTSGKESQRGFWQPSSQSEEVTTSSPSPRGTARWTYAKRYGPLDLCEHGEPLSARHAPDCSPEAHYQEPWSEAVDDWLRWVREANAILRISAALQAQQRPAPWDWTEVPSLSPPSDLTVTNKPRIETHHILFPNPIASERPERQRWSLRQAINEWLHRGNIRADLQWGDSGGTIALAGGAFDLVALSLFLAVSNEGNVLVCSGCTRPYFPRRRHLSQVRQNFCPDCRGTVAKRFQRRTQRARQQPVKRPGKTR